MENTNTNRKSSSLSIVALLLFIAAFAGAFFHLSPTWSEVSNLQKGRDEKVIERDERQAKLDELESLQQELSLTSEVSRETTLSAIPVSFGQDDLIRDLSALARKNDMVLNGLNFSVPSSASPGEVVKATINTNVTGSKSDLIGFLRGVETNGRKLLVKNITVQVGETEVGTRINFNLSMETYFQGG